VRTYQSRDESAVNFVRREPENSAVRSEASLGEYYHGQADRHGRYGAHCGEYSEVVTSVLTHPDWLDLDCLLTGAGDQLTLMGTSGSPVLSEMRGAGDLLRQQPAGEHLFLPGREVLTQDRAPADSPGGWTADGVACPALAVSTGSIRTPLNCWRGHRTRNRPQG
jgi:hypothetical protein